MNTFCANYITVLSNAIVMDFKRCSFALMFSTNPNGDGKVCKVLTGSLITTYCYKWVSDEGGRRCRAWARSTLCLEIGLEMS